MREDDAMPMTRRCAPLLPLLPLLLTVATLSSSSFAFSFSPSLRHRHHFPSHLAPAQAGCFLARANDAVDGEATPVTIRAPRATYTPSTVIAHDLTKSYPETLVSRLFSSVPRREYALDLRGTTLNLVGGGGGRLLPGTDDETDDKAGAEDDDGVILLVGASASGKSTLLRLLAGVEGPTSGTVTINDVVVSGSGGGEDGDWGRDRRGRSRQQTVRTPRPVIVDSKPRFADDSRSVGDWIEKVGFVDSGERTDYDEQHSEVIAKVAEDFCSILGLSPDQRRGRPSDLSPSGEFLFAVACGCMESVARTLHLQRGPAGMEIHCPILLLDELFDFEHPDVAAPAGRGLADLVRSGAVVVAATHKPHQLGDVSGRTITMSGGRILSDLRTGGGRNEAFAADARRRQ